MTQIDSSSDNDERVLTPEPPSLPSSSVSEPITDHTRYWPTTITDCPRSRGWVYYFTHRTQSCPKQDAKAKLLQSTPMFSYSPTPAGLGEHVPKQSLDATAPSSMVDEHVEDNFHMPYNLDHIEPWKQDAIKRVAHIEHELRIAHFKVDELKENIRTHRKHQSLEDDDFNAGAYLSRPGSAAAVDSPRGQHVRQFQQQRIDRDRAIRNAEIERIEALVKVKEGEVDEYEDLVREARENALRMGCSLKKLDT